MSGGTEGERPRRELTPGQTGQNQSPSEGGADYRALFSSIRADQDRETFVADLRQNAQQVLSLARELRVKANNEATVEERGDKVAVGVYLEVALKQFVLDINPYTPPGDGKVQVWRAGLDPFETIRNTDEDLEEWREELAFWATERVALKWIDDHPGSEAANEVAGWNIFGFHDQHQRLLQEMWPSILLHLAFQ